MSTALGRASWLAATMGFALASSSLVHAAPLVLGAGPAKRLDSGRVDGGRVDGGRVEARGRLASGSGSSVSGGISRAAAVAPGEGSPSGRLSIDFWAGADRAAICGLAGYGVTRPLFGPVPARDVPARDVLALEYVDPLTREVAASAVSVRAADTIVLRRSLDFRPDVALGWLPDALDMATPVLDWLPELEWLPAVGAVPARLAHEARGMLRAMAFELSAEPMSSTALQSLLGQLGGDVARGPYSRLDDASRSIAIDLRLVLAWRPLARIAVEGGYAVAYLRGGLTALGQQGTTFFRHGPCAGVRFDF